MNGALEVATTLAAWLTQAILLGTTLALLTWAVSRTLLRKAPPALHAALWLIVLAKFILPLGPGFSYSLASLVGLPELAPAPTGPAVDGSLTYLVLETAAAGTSEAPATATRTAAATPAALAPVAAGTGGARYWLIALVGAYVIGVIAIVIWRTRGYLAFVRRARELPLAGRGLRRLVARTCRRSGVRRVPRVRLSGGAHAPYIFGFWRPTLVLPRGSARPGPELEAILLHEIAHLRRLDLFTRLAQWLAGNLLFFWPVVAWVNRRIDLAREHACDEWALSHGRLAPGQYARCLLRALQPAPPDWSAYRPAAMATTARQVERRIAMIMEHSRRGPSSYWRLMAGSSLAAWAAFALTGTSAATEEPVQTQEKNVWVSDDGTTIEFESTNGMPGWVAEGGQQQFMFVTDAEGDGQHTVAFTRHISEDSLARFLESHPNADANADGNISAEEHDAYLVAVAMQDPARVLGQFPSADTNGDGELSPAEAAGLVGGMPHLSALAQGQPMVNVMLQSDGGEAGGVWITDDLNGAQNVSIDEHVTPDGTRIMTRVAVAGDPEVESGGNIEVNVEADDSGQRVVRIDKGDGQIQEIILAPGDGLAEIELDDESGMAGQQIIALDDGSGEINVVYGFSEEAPDDVHGHLVRLHEMLGDGAHAHLARLHEHLMELHGGEPGNVEVRVHAGDDGQHDVFVTASGDHMRPFQAGSWLLENIEGEPSREAVAGYVQTVADLPLAKFLELNPESDHNGDGVLTEKERDAFIKRHTTRQRMKLIEKYPDADLNGDGMLTNEELREYFHGQHQAHRAHGERVRVNGTPQTVTDGEPVIVVEKVDE